MNVRIVYKLLPMVAENSYGLYQVKYVGSERYYFDGNDWIGPYKETETWEPKPLFKIERDAMPDICNEFQNLGFSPDYVARAKGELDATKKHLEDMRLIALKDFK